MNIVLSTDILEEYKKLVERIKNPETAEEIPFYLLGNNKIVNGEDVISIETNNLDIDVATDEKWIIFVINQIVNNSIKYMEKDKKVITFDAREDKNKVILEILDNGCGIKESDLIRVFEKGFTGSDRKKSRSTGMGLYLSKKICNKLGLAIKMESKYKEWTKIIVEFPKSNFNKMD